MSDSKNFRIKTCLHSVSYAGFWRGQARLDVKDFLDKAKQLGFDGVMLTAKRPHVSVSDYDAAARAGLRDKIEKLGLKLVCMAGYTDFTAGVDRAGIPNAEIQACYVGQLAKLASDLGSDMVRVFTGYERPGIPFERGKARGNSAGAGCRFSWNRKGFANQAKASRGVGKERLLAGNVGPTDTTAGAD